MAETSVVQLIEPEKEKTRETWCVGEVTVSSPRSRVHRSEWDFSSAVGSEVEPRWWLMMLTAPVGCNNCLSRCSPGLRCPVRRWTRRSLESPLLTAVRLLPKKGDHLVNVRIVWYERGLQCNIEDWLLYRYKGREDGHKLTRDIQNAGCFYTPNNSNHPKLAGVRKNWP